MAEPTTERPLFQRISGRLPYLAPSLRQVGETILRDPTIIPSMTIGELAAQAGVAESTVSRFAREVGVKSYKTLVREVAEANFETRGANPADGEREIVYGGVGQSDDLATIVRKVAHSSIEAMSLTNDSLDVRALARAVSYVESASAILFACMGSSAIAAEEGVMRFTRAGRKCFLFRDQSLQVMLATIADDGDVLIAISDSGETSAVVQAVELARRRGAKTIGITSQEGSTLARAVDVALFSSNAASGGELYGESVTSKWGQLLTIDILYAAYAAAHYQTTVSSLKSTYDSGIAQSRAATRR
jgi:DNA-binding MurR/RpiR family transcriptional regulator